MVHELKRKTKNGYSLYLDYRLSGKRIQERTGLTIKNGSDTQTKLENKDNLIRFKYLLTEKQKQLLDGIASTPLSVHRQKVDFIEYFNKYIELNPSKERRAKATLKKLVEYNKTNTLPITNVTEEYLRKFKNFLEAKLTGETPYDYFKYLKMVIKQATKEKLFQSNPALDIKVICKANESKVALTIPELKCLMNSDCPNVTVKNAFLFSCLTGLRFCDIKQLTWGNIDENGVLTLVQIKTKHPLKLQLTNHAIELAGKREDVNNLIFKLPTGNGTNKNLKKWVKVACLNKKVTFHCARHSFATNLHRNGSDLLVTSAALGHKSLKETPRYIRLAEQTINNAVLNMESFK